MPKPTQCAAALLHEAAALTQRAGSLLIGKAAMPIEFGRISGSITDALEEMARRAEAGRRTKKRRKSK
jgi:hypothetical protein